MLVEAIIGGAVRRSSWQPTHPDHSPDWIIVQRSGLPYSHIAPRVIDLLPDYRLVHVIRAADLDVPGNVYDIQDGFYVPYGGFRGVRRPGPNLEIYRRKAD